MMNDVMPSIVQMDAEELQKLVAEVKETVASVIQLPKPKEKSFGHLDMWSIRRTFKSATDLMKRR
ncbi:MAG: hypothetical protein ACHQFX_10685 [Chitinophagales bacterium]